MNGVRRAVFIDRDGVIFHSVERDGFDHPTAPFREDEVHLFEGLDEALEILKEGGFLRILVTNQPDIAYGYLTAGEWQRIHTKLAHLDFDDINICFHREQDDCECRKPKPGMLYAAEKKWGINLAMSYMVGDTDKDIRAARAAGCAAILVDTPYNEALSICDFRVPDFLRAAKLIMKIEEGK